MASDTIRGEPRPRAVRSLLSLVACAAALTTAPAARAEPSLSDRETARSLMEDGDGKRDKGDLDGALKSYKAADAIMHVPTTGLEVARVQAQLGRLLEARETLSRVSRIPVKPNEPAPFAAARKAAEQLSDELAARIPAITFAVRGVDPGTPPRITVDGEVIPPAAIQAPRKVNPGRHVVAASAGAVEKTEEVTLAEGETKGVSFDLSPPAAPAESGEADGTAQGGGPGKALAIGGFALGAVGVGVGSVTGLMHLSKVGDVKKDCVGDVCPPSRADDIDSAKTLGTISTIAFVAGAVGIGVGVAGLVMSSGDGKEARGDAARRASRPGAEVHAVVGPSWLGLRGRF